MPVHSFAALVIFCLPLVAGWTDGYQDLAFPACINPRRHHRKDTESHQLGQACGVLVVLNMRHCLTFPRPGYHCRGGPGGGGHGTGTGGAGGRGMGPALNFDISVGQFTMHNNVHVDEYVDPGLRFLSDAFGTVNACLEARTVKMQSGENYSTTPVLGRLSIRIFTTTAIRVRYWRDLT
ncbi:hypothetical protein B0H13DRAFT_2448053 [Mycena leptocephala]|nr:hypothetical protein B0H13DRAFT_2448053 [Mycena leptocephala]